MNGMQHTVCVGYVGSQILGWKAMLHFKAVE
jgi:hypothetical protein